MPLKQVNEQHPHGGDWLREIVFGLNDGLVTALVFIMAVSQIAQARLLLVVLGEVEIEHEPEEEQAELVSIYQNKGFTGPLLQHVVNHLTANKERWHRAMVHDELGVVEDTQVNPWLEGMQVGLSFVLGGLIPTVPLLLSLPQARWWAYGLTALTALALGAIKAHYTRQGPVRAGLEFLVVVTLGTLAGVGLDLLLHGG